MCANGSRPTVSGIHIVEYPSDSILPAVSAAWPLVNASVKYQTPVVARRSRALVVVVVMEVTLEISV
jgi:hypothetical protein